VCAACYRTSILLTPCATSQSIAGLTAVGSINIGIDCIRAGHLGYVALTFVAGAASGIV
jgi:hypothetical protein